MQFEIRGFKLSMRHLFIAIRFLTVLPLPLQGRVRDEELGGSLLWFPLVGLLIGSLLLLVQQLVSAVVPPLVVGALLLLTWVAVTGAMHLDGLADTCDGLYGGRTREERLQIMKDPHVGAIGVVAIVSLLIAKFALLGSLPQRAATPGLWLAPCLGRWAMVFLGTTMSYARSQEGIGAPFIRHGRLPLFYGATAFTLLATWFGGGFNGLCLMVVGIAASLLLQAIFQRMLGGVTGDALGAAGELVETMVLMAAVWLTVR